MLVNIHICTDFSLLFAQVTALLVIHLNLQRWLLVVILIFGGFITFGIISKLGEKLMEKHEEKERMTLKLEEEAVDVPAPNHLPK